MKGCIPFKEGQVWQYILGISWILLLFPENVEARCGDYIKLTTSSSTGTLSSPNYPNNYDNYDVCIWLIEAPSRYAAVFTINSFTGEADGAGNCVDYLDFRDGSSTSNRQLKTCGPISSATSVTSSNRWLWIKFYADDNNTFTGFTGSYSITSTGNSDATKPISDCQAVSYACRNKECVYYSYVCDSQNDCGCVGSGCDENACGGISWSESTMVWCGVGVGIGTFNMIFLGIGILEIWLRKRQRMLNLKHEEEEAARRRKRRHQQNKS